MQSDSRIAGGPLGYCLDCNNATFPLMQTVRNPSLEPAWSNFSILAPAAKQSGCYRLWLVNST